MTAPLKLILPLTLLLTLASPANAQPHHIDRWFPIDQSCAGGADISATTDPHHHILRLTFNLRMSDRDLLQEYIFQNSQLIRVNERITIPQWNDQTATFDYLHGSPTYRRYEITAGSLTSFHHLGDNSIYPTPSTAPQLLHNANLYKKIAHSPPPSELQPP